MFIASRSRDLVGMLNEVLIGLLRGGCSLSARQLAAFLVCCMAKAPCLSSDLFKELNISRAALSAVLDRLVLLGLVYREKGIVDRQSFYIRPTLKGMTLLAEIKCLAAQASTAV